MKPENTIKALFVDFYGTLVHEDGKIVREISQELLRTGTANNPAEIGAYWWEWFRAAFTDAYGDRFQTQRALEYQSLCATIRHFHASADAWALSEKMFAHWQSPPIFDDTKAFFADSPLPIYVVSNIDRADIEKAVSFHGLRPAGICTSEDARSYKPRKELFEYALRIAACQPEEVVHIGDSLTSDVQGAGALGIRTIWLNRGSRTIPSGVSAADTLIKALDLVF